MEVRTVHEYSAGHFLGIDSADGLMGAVSIPASLGGPDSGTDLSCIGGKIDGSGRFSLSRWAYEDGRQRMTGMEAGVGV